MSIKYQQLFTEQKTSKTIVMTFGRMNPVTKGHSTLVDAVSALAQKLDAESIIFVSKSQDSTKNPLNINQKLAYLRDAYKGITFSPATSDAPSLIHVVKTLSGKYDNLYIVAGSDRVSEFKSLLDKYNGKDYNFKKIVVVSAGERDSDVDGASGMSASKMREFAKNNNFTKFKAAAPSTLSLPMIKKMYDDVRHGMNITECRDATRELYLKETIFSVGDIVFYKDELATIGVRGSNHVIILKEDGTQTRAWLSEIYVTDQINEEIKMLHENKLKIARIIGMSLGYTEAEDNNDPTDIINSALKVARGKALNADAKRILQRMMDTAKIAKISYNDSLAKQVMSEDSTMTYKKLKDVLCSVSESEKDKEELSDDEIEKLFKDLSDDDMIDMCYDDDELVVVDDDGDVVEEDYDFTEINEVLSRVERMKTRIHMARSRAKRGKKLKMALKRKSSTPVLVARARRAAVRLLKKRLARKSAAQMSVGEKERVERRLKNMKSTINRIATKLLPKVRQVEKTRLSNLANKRS